MAEPKATKLVKAGQEIDATECCGNCVYFQMADSPEAMINAVQTPAIVAAVQGCCLRYPPSVFPVGQRNVIEGAAIQMASVSVRVVVGATDWCGEFAPHGPLQ